MIPRNRVLGVGISAVNLEVAASEILAWIEVREPKYVCVRDVHGVVRCQDDDKLRRAHEAAGMVTPDGMPLVWLSRMAGARHVRRVYGPDLMLELCRRGMHRGTRHYFYGSSEEVLEALRARLRERFPNIAICGSYAPPFSPVSREQDAAIVRRIRDARADIVWVGLGTPKQELWMAEHVGLVGDSVLIGVGAAFDFHAGAKRQAPRWVQRSGLEWLFRLLSEPARLGPRYARYLPRFVWLLVRERVRARAGSP